MNAVYPTRFSQKLKDFILKTSFPQPALLFVFSLAFLPGCFQQSAPERLLTADSPAQAAAIGTEVEAIIVPATNQLDSFPANLELFPRLKKLSLRGQKNLGGVPASLGGAKSLHTLDLSETGIRALPESAAAMSGLRHLYLTDNGITNLPDRKSVV